MVLIGVAVFAIVAVTLVTVLLARKNNAHGPIINSSVDACQLVTAADASTVFGGNAGVPHLVLGDCVYDDGTHELIVAVARFNAKSQFDAGRTKDVTVVPALGDSAYYSGGKLSVLKGTSLIQITLGPTPAAAPNPKVVALARAAVNRLSLVSG